MKYILFLILFPIYLLVGLFISIGCGILMYFALISDSISEVREVSNDMAFTINNKLRCRKKYDKF